MRHLRVLLATLATVFAASSASALVEIRAGYASNNGSPQTFNDLINASCSPCANLSAANGLTFDAIVKAPVIPFGIGLRYEDTSANVEFGSGGADIKVKYAYTRTALLLNYRLINTLAYFGPILTYGLSNKGTVNIEGPLAAELTAGSTSSYSVGLEAGAKLLFFNIGAEIGYSHMGSADLRTSDNQVVQIVGSNLDNVPMTGSYMKAFVGVSF